MFSQLVIAEVLHGFQVHPHVVISEEVKDMLYQILQTTHTYFKGYSVSANQKICAHLILEAYEHLEFLYGFLAKQAFMVQGSHSSDCQAELIAVHLV
ncbi:MAG: hypothetical protein BWX92_04090 [Deltaproteobacteria bacterium ADurb.Bin135]|nr:MAG: hypothetical protein BWX92_04090 [Deltaproteobacteria bacterium ADurb.Bin135]